MATYRSYAITAIRKHSVVPKAMKLYIWVAQPVNEMLFFSGSWEWGLRSRKNQGKSGGWGKCTSECRVEGQSWLCDHAHIPYNCEQIHGQEQHKQTPLELWHICHSRENEFSWRGVIFLSHFCNGMTNMVDSISDIKKVMTRLYMLLCWICCTDPFRDIIFMSIFFYF